MVMEEISNVLINFITSLRTELLEYYERVYSYIKDLFAEKSIDLKFKTSYETDKVLRETVGTMVRTVKLAMQTIGVPRKDMKLIENQLDAAIEKKGDAYPDYNSYFVKDIKVHIDKFLFRFLVEYLIDYDFSKIENLDLFDLLPRRFTAQLDQFKEDFIGSTSLKRQINEIIEEVGDYIDYTDLSFIGSSGATVSKPAPAPKPEPKIIPKEAPKPIPQPEVEAKIEPKIKPKIDPKPALKAKPPITPVTKAEPSKGKETLSIDIDALKQSIKSSIKIGSKPLMEKTPSPPITPPTPPKIEPKAEPSIKEITPSPKSTPVQPDLPAVEVSAIIAPSVPETTKTFLEYIGASMSLDSSMVSKIKINKENLISCQGFNGKFFNLEALFYYISILKMLDIPIPFTPERITNITQNYINNKKIFSVSVMDQADPLNVFYGLSLYSEMDLLNQGYIDLLNIEIFLESELSQFNAEQLHLNFHSLLGLKLLEKSGAIIADKSGLLNPLLGLELADLEEYNPVLDIYELLSTIKLIDKSTNLHHFKALYAEEIKKLISLDTGAVKDTITDSARTLLIFSLLELHKQEFNTTQKLLRYIASTTEYFSGDISDEDFNWKNDPLGFLVELRMLYWALLACSQYNVIM